MSEMSIHVEEGLLTGCDNETVEARRPVSILRWQPWLIAASILLLAMAHWVVGKPDKQIHNLLYNLDFVPILAGAMLFGWRGAVGATLLTVVAELPNLLFLWPNDPTYRADQLGETLASGIGGVVVGLLASRERRHRTELEATTRELSRVNQELQQNMDKLAKAERMYAVAQLSASLAHEIRNPLAGISGAAGILRRGHASATRVEECCEIIEKESQRLNQLLANFLHFARPRAPRIQPADLTAIIDSTIALAQHSKDAAAIRFHRYVQPDMPEVACDSEQMKQVLLNLVLNAVQATREGSVHLDAHVQGKTACISVRDEGEGVPQDRVERIFDPFYTTKANGSGLGLAIASKIVEQHRGKLTARTEPGRGLTMVLELPVSRVSDEP